MKKLRLGMNIDHIATIRNARGGVHPDPVRAAILAEQSGADGITIHLREDRRHIRDADVMAVKQAVSLPLNLEMAATEEMLDIALRTIPHAACIVPEKRQEVTTEGGLDVAGGEAQLSRFVGALRNSGIRVSLFIDPDATQIDAAKRLGADIVEFHTGQYADTSGAAQQHELERIATAVDHAHSLGIECHAGHGLSYENVKPIAALNKVVELNIGHFLVGEAVFVGMELAIRQMRGLMDEARIAAAA